MQQEMIFLPAAPEKEENNFHSFLTGRNVARVHSFHISKNYLKRKKCKIFQSIIKDAYEKDMQNI